MSAGALIRSTAEPEARRGTPPKDVNTNNWRRPSSRSHTIGLFESTSPGNVMLRAGLNVVRGMGGAAAVTAMRLEPGMTFGRTSRTSARTSDDETLVFTASDYGSVDAFVSPSSGSTRYPVHR